MPSVEHPDYEAARGIMSNDTWSNVHQRWEGRTGERLSPNSFGKRILPVVHDLQKPPEQPTERKGHRSTPSRGSRESLPVANGPVHPSNGTPVTRQRLPDNLEAQRADISRIDSVVGHLQGEVNSMRGLIAELRYEFQNRDIRRSSGEGDNTTLDSLSETVSRIASRTGEVDGLRFELTALKGKIKRMEEAAGMPTTPGQPTGSFPRAETSAPMQRIPSQQQQAAAAPPAPLAPQHQDIAPRGWNAVNSGKRKSFDADAHPYADTTKRPRSEYRTASGESAPTYTQPPPSGAAPPVLAPIRSNSQDSWHPDSQRLPPLRGMHQSGRGRPPRIAQHPEITTEWERESWNAEERVGPDGYYRSVGGPPSAAPVSPNTASKRGTMVRRGTAGGPLQYIDPAPAKRTRQRPVRNEHGVLIRKDGKPDQRSISSPQNLRKVHERRMAEQEKGSQGSPANSPSSPADTEDPKAFPSEERESIPPSSKSGSPREYTDSRPQSSHLSKHDRVMNKMFPEGVANDSERMDHAGHIFESSEEKHHTAQPRDEMVREEAHESTNATKEAERVDPDAMEVDAPPPKSSGGGHEEQPSGSLYVPSQDTEETENNDGAKSLDKSRRKAESQDSDNRPLRPRNRNIERVQEEAGSVAYQTTSAEEVSAA